MNKLEYIGYGVLLAIIGAALIYLCVIAPAPFIYRCLRDCYKNCRVFLQTNRRTSHHLFWKIKVCFLVCVGISRLYIGSFFDSFYSGSSSLDAVDMDFKKFN